MTSYTVVQEYDDGRDRIVATGFPTERDAWSWAKDYSLYYSKRWRRYAFLRVDLDPAGEVHQPPSIPKIYNKDARPWWKRLLDR